MIQFSMFLQYFMPEIKIFEADSRSGYARFSKKIKNKYTKVLIGVNVNVLSFDRNKLA